MQRGLKYNGIHLQTLGDKDSTYLSENKFGGGICSIMSEKYVESDEKNLKTNATILYGRAMSQFLPYD